VAFPLEITRPQRWDEAFGALLSDAEVDRVLACEPFRTLDPAAFPQATPLREILRNDGRFVRCAPGQVLCQAGTYGTSVFFVLSGRVRVVVSSPPGRPLEEQLDRDPVPRLGPVRALAQLFRRPRWPEVRRLGTPPVRREGEDAVFFLPDLTEVLERHETVVLGPGRFFGELGALGRTPRSATVFAEHEAELLELRWQGLRDLCRRGPALQHHIDELYRANALSTQLAATPLFRHLRPEQLAQVATETVVESYGDRGWAQAYRRLEGRDPADRLQEEPVVVREGDYPNGVLIVRTGFARVTERVGSGERTVACLGPGQVFGLDEALLNRGGGQPIPHRKTLRALGYLDVLLVPTAVLEALVFPDLPQHARPERRRGREPGAEEHTVLLEELVQHRLVNGTQAMVIDLERCTRCDDCVRACAATHQGNPRFLRQGTEIGRRLFAHACMHCVDPVCMIGCPTGAIFREPEAGRVVINDRTCIGCGTCASNCPYDNIRMVEVREPGGALIIDEETKAPILRATKCDLCLGQPAAPACANACPHDALRRVDLSDPEAVESLLRW
jgi:Fe-S-cluster-containing dehydrogenase component/CRP-like cAMP-binding protein